MSSSLPDIGLKIRLARGGRSDGIPILLTSPWPESIYAFRGILPAIKELGPLILVGTSSSSSQNILASAVCTRSGLTLGPRRYTIDVNRWAW